MSTIQADPLLRLRSVPWDALEPSTPAALLAISDSLAGQPAERVLDSTLRHHRHLSQPQRLALAEAVFGTSLWRRRLARLPTSEIPPASGEPQDFATRHSLPDWLAQTILREAGPQADSLADALNLPGPISIRSNSLRTTRHSLAARLQEEGVESNPGSLAPHSLTITSPRPNIYGLPSFREGLFEVQDEGSQLLAELLETQPGETILDACAGAGGKTLALAARLQNSGHLHAYDPDHSKLHRLRLRASRAGVTCLQIHLRPPPPLTAQRILVDAPCSELGALRRGPDARFRIHPDSFPALERLQLEILEHALAHLTPGGRLLYATCTFRREENQDIAFELERRHPEIKRLPLSEDGFLHLWPHLHGTDAFFAAAYTRAA
ncbi:MAG: RsmB/NOP family class I SAM-dependent RNA methyltransferase [Myxococcales bacterium]|nr:RsmB/NOP family class I SAM-dependent RNA methyltransferase [Myxococcales bacterium]